MCAVRACAVLLCGAKLVHAVGRRQRAACAAVGSRAAGGAGGGGCPARGAPVRRPNKQAPPSPAAAPSPQPSTPALIHPGLRPAPLFCRRYKALNNLHPLGLTEDWSDKLRDQAYMSDARGATFEHYMQVGGGRRFVCEGVEVGGCAWVPKKGRWSLPCLPEPA